MTIEQIYPYYLQSNSVQTDSRSIQKGNLFVALKGDTFDGNKYAKQAIEKGASFAIIDDSSYQANTEQYILVENTLETLQNLARYHRKQLQKVACIAITGSNGKTTTKELLAAVLATTYRTQATKGNFNNHIGLPLTLLALKSDVQMAIVEMGANHLHEINQLCGIALPNFGLITNIGRAHLEGFGSIEGIQKGKGELFEYLEAAQGRVFLNTNDQKVADLGYYIQKVSTYGSDKWSKVRGVALESKQPFLKVRFFPKKPRSKAKNEPAITPIDIQTQLTGQYNLDNVLAAIAVGTHFKVPLEQIKAAIESYRPANNRSQVVQQGSNTVLLDAYNANPSSMKAALKSFEGLNTDNNNDTTTNKETNQESIISSSRKKIVILGDMLELGAFSEDAHREIVEQAQAMPLEKVILVGQEFKAVEKYFGNHFLHFAHVNAAKVWYQSQDLQNYDILIKGSRGIALENILT